MTAITEVSSKDTIADIFNMILLKSEILIKVSAVEYPTLKKHLIRYKGKYNERVKIQGLLPDKTRWEFVVLDEPSDTGLMQVIIRPKQAMTFIIETEELKTLD